MDKKKEQSQRQTNFLGYQGVFVSKVKEDGSGGGNLIISINNNTILVVKREKVLEVLGLEDTKTKKGA